MTTAMPINPAASLAIESQGLDQLKLQAKRDPDKALAATAKQFEAMFLGMIMKSMREATPKDGLLDSEQTKTYTAMLDQQFAQQMASRGTGLAAALTRQLSQGKAPDAAPVGDMSSTLQMSTIAMAKLNLEALAVAPSQPAAPNFDVQPLSLDEEAWGLPSGKGATMPLARAPLMAAIAPAAWPTRAAAAATPPVNIAAAVAATPATGAAPLSQTGDFVNRIWSHAVDAARSIGVRPQFMVGQAALESGWGKHEIRNADGSGTHNLFGVKAGRGWNGPSVEKTTTEYVNGVAHKTSAKFRVYASYGEAFKDYAKLIGGNPRYAGVMAQAQDAQGFARGLQQAGYATDPSYADKLVRVINSATMRQSLAYAPPAQPLPQMLAQR
jgi:flagellar protein FlgJ